MQVISPLEDFPGVGTVANPAVFFDGSDALVSYEASVRAGGGNVVLRFIDVIDIKITPMNVEGLNACRYRINPWAFNEIIGVEEVAKWSVLHARLWLISFNDLMIEVIFEAVTLVSHDNVYRSPHLALAGVVRNDGLAS